MKNITLSADEHMIQLARKKACRQKKTLNALFREWLKQYIMDSTNVIQYEKIMERLSYVNPGKHFNRDELNER